MNTNLNNWLSSISDKKIIRSEYSKNIINYNKPSNQNQNQNKSITSSFQKSFELKDINFNPDLVNVELSQIIDKYDTNENKKSDNMNNSDNNSGDFELNLNSFQNNSINNFGNSISNSMSNNYRFTDSSYFDSTINNNRDVKINNNCNNKANVINEVEEQKENDNYNDCDFDNISLESIFGYPKDKKNKKYDKKNEDNIDGAQNNKSYNVSNSNYSNYDSLENLGFKSANEFNNNYFNNNKNKNTNNNINNYINNYKSNNYFDDEFCNCCLDNDNYYSTNNHNYIYNNNNKPFNTNNINPSNQNFTELQKIFSAPSTLNHTLADMKEWSKSFPWDKEVNDANEKIFGNTKFRPNQREIINANLSNKDIFVCMPTGGGKSLTFQIPAIISDGVTLVVMPLLSLIQDQTGFLKSIGVNALFLNKEGSDLARTCYNDLFHNPNPELNVKMIFLTPEKIANSKLAMELLFNLNNENLLVRAVIDEAHCVSQWGREFRSDYLNLRILKQKFPSLPILAITATAPNQVREDVINQLNMKNTLFFRSSYNRSNLFIEIRNKKDCNDIAGNIAQFIKSNYPHETGLIYCSSKKNCEVLSKTLKSKFRLNCAFYHASMSEREKTRVQEQWKNDQIKIIIATVAFGMGINKPDVRFVIHHSMPKSFEGYYQEIGRAGRDGEKSHCILYYSAADRKIVEFLMSKTHLTREQMCENLRKTTEMVEYCEESCQCRRVSALMYFDEKFNREDCHQMCDNCSKGLKTKDKDVTDESLSILSLLENCKKSSIEMTIAYTADYLKGKRNDKKPIPKSDKNFGKLKSFTLDEVKKLIRKLIIWKYIDEYLTIMGENVYSKIEISNNGINFINNNNKTKIIVSFLKTKADEEEEKRLLKEKNNEENNNDNKTNKKSRTKIKDNKNNSNNLHNNDSQNSVNKNSNPSNKRPRYRRNYEDSDDNNPNSNLNLLSINNDASNNQNSSNNQNMDYGLSTKEEYKDLLEKLKTRRREIVEEENKKLFEQCKGDNYNPLNILNIFSDNGLMNLARKLPTTKEELNTNYIFGVSGEILSAYGEKFLKVIEKHIITYNIDKDKRMVKSGFKVRKEIDNTNKDNVCENRGHLDITNNKNKNTYKNNKIIGSVDKREERKSMMEKKKINKDDGNNNPKNDEDLFDSFNLECFINENMSAFNNSQSKNLSGNINNNNINVDNYKLNLDNNLKNNEDNYNVIIADKTFNNNKSIKNIKPNNNKIKDNDSDKSDDDFHLNKTLLDELFNENNNEPNEQNENHKSKNDTNAINESPNDNFNFCSLGSDFDFNDLNQFDNDNFNNFNDDINGNSDIKNNPQRVKDLENFSKEAKDILKKTKKRQAVEDKNNYWKQKAKYAAINKNRAKKKAKFK